MVAVTALAAATGHLIRFVETGGDVIQSVIAITLFRVPGVIIGGQLGARVASRLPQRKLERGLGVLFILVAALLLANAAL